MPALIRLYLRSIVAGILLSAAFVGALLALDVAHLRHLILEASGGMIALFLLLAFHTILFSGVQFGYAVMAMKAREEPPSGGSKAPLTGAGRRPALIHLLKKVK